MAVAKRSASPARKRASAAPKRASVLAPVLLPHTPSLAVPTLGPNVNADGSFAALKIPVKVSGKASTAGVVFLRGTLFADPSHPPGAPCLLFTLPAGMRPSCEGYLHATYRDQGPGPVVPILLKLDTSGAVSLFAGPPLMYDSMIWLEGVSFMQ